MTPDFLWTRTPRFQRQNLYNLCKDRPKTCRCEDLLCQLLNKFRRVWSSLRVSQIASKIQWIIKTEWRTSPSKRTTRRQREARAKRTTVVGSEFAKSSWISLDYATSRAHKDKRVWVQVCSPQTAPLTILCKLMPTWPWRLKKWIRNLTWTKLHPKASTLWERKACSKRLAKIQAQWAFRTLATLLCQLSSEFSWDFV